MRLGCGMFIVGMAMLVMGCWGGMQRLYVSATNTSPTEMTCAEYIEQRPSASWLKLTECRADVIESVIETERFSDVIEKAWIPVYPVDADPGGPVAVVLESDSEEMIGKLNQITRSFEAAGEDPEKMLQALIQAREIGTFPMEGLVAFGYDLEDDEIEKVSGLVPELGSNFAVLRDGDAPSFMGAILHLLMALGGALVLFVLFAMLGSDEE